MSQPGGEFKPISDAFRSLQDILGLSEELLPPLGRDSSGAPRKSRGKSAARSRLRRFAVASVGRGWSRGDGDLCTRSCWEDSPSRSLRKWARRLDPLRLNYDVALPTSNATSTALHRFSPKRQRLFSTSKTLYIETPYKHST